VALQQMGVKSSFKLSAYLAGRSAPQACLIDSKMNKPEVADLNLRQNFYEYKTQ
jgi:hypothetical protein